MSNIKVSVLVTFYNQESYVDTALQSIFNQVTDFDFEVLVGDDGSSDGTCDAVKRWIEKYPGRVELYVMDRAPGQYIGGFRASRNRLNLLPHVKGEYFIYLDGDDYFSDSSKLQKQINILESPENADCSACAHNTGILFPDGRMELTVPERLPEGKYTPAVYWKNLYFHTDALLIRSSIIAGLPTRLLENNFNDILITLSVLQHGSIYYLPDVMAIYLQTGTGIWTGGKAVVNAIRNVSMYDLSIQMCPELQKQADHRFRSIWHDLLRVRSQINAANLTALDAEAADKHLENAARWIHYAELSAAEQRKLCLDALRRSGMAIPRHYAAKIYHALVKRK